MPEKPTTFHQAALSTWQWLGVIAVIIGGTIGIDQRMQSTVRVFADTNAEDHIRIRAELKDLANSLPPTWLTNQVEDNQRTIAEIRSDLNDIKVGIAELKTGISKLSPKG